MAELKPCPFCGRVPTIENCKDFGYFVKCKCGIEQSTLYAQRCDAVKRWNKRKPEPHIVGKHADVIVMDEPQTKFPCDNCANKGDHNGECSNCVADSEPIRWKTPSHYKPKTKSQKAIKDLQEYYGIKQEPMLSEMV